MVYQSLDFKKLPAALSRVCFGLVVALLAACAETGPKSADISTGPPAVPREFRAVWVASVANIDWPSKRDLTVAQQQAEIVSVLDRAKELNLNAVVLQVRTSADALYDSSIEPWSEYLTGTQGKAPEPFYDPLKMWVEEAHQRGLELHAWFNPYRARSNQAKSVNAKSHIANTNPAVVKAYGGFLWMDPGEPSASEQTLKVILDVVRRYDIDGVHIDDYFYPYPIPVPGSAVPPPSADDTPQPRAELPFPDEPAWQAYLKNGTSQPAHNGSATTAAKLSRADWRRQNVNNLIERIHFGIKSEKAWVKFGISPFGLGKPEKRPPGIAGFSQYDKLYADAELWLQKGWLDYFTPQLYWAVDQKAQAYGVLLDYWAKENTMGRHLWPGLYTSRINDTDKSWQPEEIIKQIDLTRAKSATDPLVSGHVHFSMVAMVQNRRGLNDHLKTKLYQTPALIPASPWLGKNASLVPVVTISRDLDRPNKILVRLSQPTESGSRAASHAVVWTLVNGSWQLVIEAIGNDPAVGSGKTMVLDELSGLPDAIVVSIVDRVGNESPRIRINQQQLLAAKGALWAP